MKPQKFVKDPKANKQLVMINTLHKKGHASKTIAAFLNSKNERYLADDSDWTAEKVEQAILQIDVIDAPTPQQETPAKKKTSLFTWLVLIIIIYVIYLMVSSPTTVRTSPSTPTPVKTSKQPASKPAWTYFTTTDEMTGEQSAYATSPDTYPTREMDFPYKNVYATILIGCNSEKEWVYVWFSKSPNITDDETEDGYNAINTRVRWNDRVETVKFTQAWGSKAISFSNDKTAINNIIKSRKLLLELNWYGLGITHFPFTLRGSSAALKEIRAICAK